MAKGGNDAASQCSRIIEEVRNGVFRPVYLLMGDEPYYPELACRAIMENCLQDYERDFNETVCFGPDVTVEQAVERGQGLVEAPHAELVEQVPGLGLGG